MDEKDALRIGIVLGGRIVEERVIRERRAVTVGQSARATFAVPGSATLPRALTVVEPDGAGWTLIVPDGCEGRLSDGAEPRPLAPGRVPLSARARGRLAIGDVTVLFQRLAVPARRPRARLPASVRTPFGSRIDGALALVLVLSLAAHFGCVGYLRTLDFPRRPDISEPPPVAWIPTRLHPLPKKDPEPPKTKSAGAPGRATPRRAPAPVEDAAVRRARLAAAVQNVAAMRVLTARGEGDNPVQDVLGGGFVAADADRVFAGVNRVNVAQNGTPTLVARGDAAPPRTVRGGIPLKARDLGDVHTGDRGGERPIEIKGDPPTEITGEVHPDPTAIVADVHSRIGGVRACYEEEARHGGGIGGRLVVRFDVSAIGKVVGAVAEEDTVGSPRVTACVLQRVRTWRFRPQGGAFSFSTPFILIAR
jgi:hypothetical protein